jgi:two-component system heavy metal sensor histidine kinase CusS
MMGFFIHKLVMHHFETQDRTQLEGKIQLIQNLLQQHPKNSPELNLYLKDALVGHHDLMVQIERPTGKVLFSSAPSIINTQQLIKSANNSWIKWKVQNKTYRGMIYTRYK